MDASGWRADWAWSLPLIVLTVVIHVLGLGLINERVAQVWSETVQRRHLTAVFAFVMGGVVLLITLLHATEAITWALAYWLLGALPDTRSAVLYSLGAMTTYGNSGFELKDHWRLMGALEALNGMLLFGLTTAFLFAMIEKLWPIGARRRRRDR